MDDYISFKSSDNKIIYVKKISIVNKFPVLSRLLNFDNAFNDVPKKDDKNNYLFFDKLNSESIMFIFRFLEIDLDNGKHISSLLNYIHFMKNNDFIEAVDFCEPLSLYIDKSFWNEAHKEPLSHESDVYNEYEFFNFLFNVSEVKSHEILKKYTDNGWVIVHDEIITYTGGINIPRVQKITLRKKIKK